MVFQGRIEKNAPPRPGSRSLPSRAGHTSHAPTATSANIKVVVRVRPANGTELQANSRVVVEVVDQQMLIFDPREELTPFYYQGVQQQPRGFLRRPNKELKFMFDNVFGWAATNDDVFKATTKDMLSSLMDGFNCSVFVYGATGAGKTFTMIGNKEFPGITYLTMDHLFVKLESYKTEREFEIHVSYLEVYNENVFDLLHPSKKPLQLREDAKFGVMVAGLTLSSIKTARELLDMLEQGNRNRTQHPTDANAESSRSHAVFQVYLKMRYKMSGELRIVKLSMIDLAGSERAAATGCVGERFKEGASINRSLLSLGNCINKLSDGVKYIPYRDSKLTRLLKDSLGGNCCTIMIANVSPSSLTYDDTYNTLKYAARANKIQMNIKKNIMGADVRVSQYTKLIDELRNKIKELEARPPTAIKEEPTVDKEKLIRWRRRLEEEYHTCALQESRLLAVVSQQRVLVLRQHAKKRSLVNLEHLALHRDNHIMEQLNFEDIPRQARSVDSFTRQIKTLQAKWHSLWTKWSESKNKIAKLFVEALCDCPELVDFVDKLKMNSEVRIMRARCEHQRKLMKIQIDETNNGFGYFKDMSTMMSKMFLMLKGYDKVTPAMSQEFMDVTKKAKCSRAVSFEDDAPSDDETDVLFRFTTDLDLEKPNDVPITLLHGILETSEHVSPKQEEASESSDIENVIRKRKIKSDETIVIEDSFNEKIPAKVRTPTPMKKRQMSPSDNGADIENIQTSIDPSNLNSTFVLNGKVAAVKPAVKCGGAVKKGLSDMTNTHRNTTLAKVMKPVRNHMAMRKPANALSRAAFGSTVSRLQTPLNRNVYGANTPKLNSAKKRRFSSGRPKTYANGRPLFK